MNEQESTRLLRLAVDELISFEQNYRAAPDDPFPERENSTIIEIMAFLQKLEKRAEK